jgi:ferredoxin-thioredoxin reductase catalytic subunit
MSEYNPSKEQIETLYNKLKKESEEGGYHLNPDNSFTIPLIEGLLINEQRYGYHACPCRLAEGSREEDLDIICPCIYRDPDLFEHNACYCGLYVTEKAIKEKIKLKPLPDRHTLKKESGPENVNINKLGNLKYPIWRCSVCGYICARENPPEKCPICKVPKERFEIFISN